MCLHTSIFIKTPSLEGLPTKAKEDPSHNEMRLSPTGHQPSISWSQRLIYLLRIFCEKNVIKLLVIRKETIKQKKTVKHYYYYYYYHYYYYYYYCYYLVVLFDSYWQKKTKQTEKNVKNHYTCMIHNRDYSKHFMLLPFLHYRFYKVPLATPNWLGKSRINIFRAPFLVPFQFLSEQYHSKQSCSVIKSLV